MCYVFLRFRTSLYNLVMGLLLVGSSTFDARFLPFNIIGIDQNLFWELKMMMLTNLLGQFVYIMYTLVIFQFNQLFRIDMETKDWREDRSEPIIWWITINFDPIQRNYVYEYNNILEYPVRFISVDHPSVTALWIDSSNWVW